jgi:hypothetical protein
MQRLRWGLPGRLLELAPILRQAACGAGQTQFWIELVPGRISMHSVGQTSQHFSQPMQASSKIE